MNKKSIVVMILSLFFIGCQIGVNQTDQQNNVIGNIPNKEGVLIEIPVIAKLSLAELEQNFGTPKDETKTDYISRRIYSLNNGEAEIEMAFNKKGQIVEMRLELKNRLDTSEEVLKLGGFDLGDSKPDWENAIVKEYSNRSFNNVRFEEISVGMHPPTKKWDELRIVISRN